MSRSKPLLVIGFLAAVLIVICVAGAVSSSGLIFEHYYLWRLTSADDAGQRVAARKLAQTRSIRAVPALLERVPADRTPTMGYQQTMESVRYSSLKPSYRVSEPPWKHFAVVALTDIGETAVPILVDKLSDPDDTIRGRAGYVLGRRPELMKQESIHRLVDAVKENPRRVSTKHEWMPYAGRLLVDVGGPAVDPVSTLLDSDRHDVRSAAAMILAIMAQSGTDAAGSVDALTRSLKDHPSTRATVAWTLSCIGPDAHAARPALLEMSNDPDRDVRRAAEGALKRIGVRARRR